SIFTKHGTVNISYSFKSSLTTRFTAVAYLQDPTETPTITPTNPPTPTPVYVTPLPANMQAPTWAPIEGEITSSDINAYDCGPGHRREVLHCL
ncbi:MAG TPA: hypothetical protein PLV45_10055, partial [bacterium]|nr:hypothetical protein [bacterium]